MATKAVTQSIPEDEPKFSVAQMRAHCVRLFDISSSTFDGAMYGHTDPMTLEEAKAIIKDWLGKEAK